MTSRTSCPRPTPCERKRTARIDLLAFVVVLVLTAASPLHASTGTVRGLDKTFFGIYDVSYDRSNGLQSRDVVQIERNGRFVGEAVVFSVHGTRVLILPRGDDVRLGDTVRLLHRADNRVFEAASDRPPLGVDAPTVMIRGRDEVDTAPDAAVESSAGYGSYGYGYGWYGYGYETPPGSINGQTKPAPTPTNVTMPQPGLPSQSGPVIPSTIHISMPTAGAGVTHGSSGTGASSASSGGHR